MTSTLVDTWETSGSTRTELERRAPRIRFSLAVRAEIRRTLPYRKKQRQKPVQDLAYQRCLLARALARAACEQEQHMVEDKEDVVQED